MSNNIVLTIDFSTLLKIVGPVIETAKPVLLRGRHGIGKSELIYEIASRTCWDENSKTINFHSTDIKDSLPVIERRISQMTEGDLIGLPVISGNRTSFNPPDWFKQACESPVILFLDEIDRGTIELRQGIFELTDSRKLNGHKLHPGTRIFAAINGGNHSNQYQVGEMDPAELDRWTIFDLEPTIDDWISWANTKINNVSNVHPTIIDFINQNRKHLEHIEGEYEPNKKYPSRRSWKRCSDVISKTKFLEQYDSDCVFLVSGFVGAEAGICFSDFIKNKKYMITPNDIINHGNYKLTEKFSINDHNALIDKMDQPKILINELLSQQQLENLARYFINLPSEIAVKLFILIGRSVNKIKFYKLVVDGVSIQKFSVDILCSQQKNLTENK